MTEETKDTNNQQGKTTVTPPRNCDNLIKLVSMLDVKCPCCGADISEKFIDFYCSLHTLASRQAWERATPGRRALQKQVILGTLPERIEIQRKNRLEHRFKEETIEKRRRHAKKMGEKSVARIRELASRAEHDMEANKQMRKHVIARVRNKMTATYESMKSILAAVTHGVIIRARNKKLVMEITNQTQLMDYILASKVYAGRQVYKMNLVMEDGKPFGKLFFEDDSHENREGHYVYGVPIPSIIPDLPDTLMKYARNDDANKNVAPGTETEDAQ